MAKIEFLRDFNYSNDRLIIGDMEQRDKSYIVMLQKKLNEAIDLLNNEFKLRIQRDNEFAKRIEIAEHDAAKKITGDSERKTPKKEE